MTDVKKFEHDPYVLALGMSFVNVGYGLWVLVATVLNMPVSTTHANVGAVMGIGIVAWCVDGVVWDDEKGGIFEKKLTLGLGLDMGLGLGQAKRELKQSHSHPH